MVDGEEQREAAAHAEPDDTDLAGAVVTCREPRTHRVDVVEGAALAGGQVTERRHHAGDTVAACVEVGCDGEIPVGREPVGVLTRVGRHAEGVVDDDDARPGTGARRLGEMPRSGPAGPGSWDSALMGGRRYHRGIVPPNDRPRIDDTIGLLEGIASTRAIRRYRDEPVPTDALAAMMFAATRAPSGSNRQPFRFLVLRRRPEGARGEAAHRRVGPLDLGREARPPTATTAARDAKPNTPKARMARTMQHYVDHFEDAPVLVLPCLVRYRQPVPTEGASIYPACQNLLLAARALGYGGVMTGFRRFAESELRALLEIPDEVFIAATITIGKPVGGHGPVRRRPIAELVYEEIVGPLARVGRRPARTAAHRGGPTEDSPTPSPQRSRSHGSHQPCEGRHARARARRRVPLREVCEIPEGWPLGAQPLRKPRTTRRRWDPVARSRWTR